MKLIHLLFIIYLIIITGYQLSTAQDKQLNYKAAELYSKLNSLYDNKEYEKILDACTEILSIDNEDGRAKSIFKQIFIQHQKEIKDFSKYYEIIFLTNSDFTNLELPPMIKLAYEKNDTARIDILLDKFANKPIIISQTKEFNLSDIDPKINPKYYLDIMKVILPHLDKKDSYLLALNSYTARNNKIFKQIIETTDFPNLELDRFFSFDEKLNPEMYPVAVKNLVPWLSPNDAFNVYVIGYNKSDSVLINNTRDIIQINYHLIEIPERDIDILLYVYDPSIAKVVYENLLRKKSISEIDSSEDIILKYNCLKLSYIVGHNQNIDIFSNMILSEIGIKEGTMKDISVWTIIAFLKNENIRARAIMSRLFGYGSNEEHQYFKNELLWWYENRFGTPEMASVLMDIYNTDTTSVQQNNSPLSTEEHITEQKTDNYDNQYYALIMSVQDYSDDNINDLVYPQQDALSLASVLEQYYSFDQKNIIILNNPTRHSIITTIQNLRYQLSESDNLLVFYAGHGLWDEDMQQGYWLPSDASISDPANWISNSDIRDYIKAIKTKHTLLIADACFSGGIFKTRDVILDASKTIQDIFNTTSRRAITSGAKKTVPDKSVFIEYLIKRLKENKEKFLETQRLFLQMKDAVINNSPVRQTPMYGIIQDTGDEGGGDFIFIRK